MVEKPVFLFVPGAWHSPRSYDAVAKLLAAQGYKYKYVHLASVGASHQIQPNDADVQIIQNATQDLLDEGKNVVLVMHSYGGAVGSEAMKYFIDEATGQFREQKNAAKVVRMVWLASFVLPKGGSLMAALGFKDTPVSGKRSLHLRVSKLTESVVQCRCMSSVHVLRT